MLDSIPALSSLRRDRAPSPGLRRYSWLFPVAVLGGFILLFLLLFRDRLLPAASVRVAPALAISEGAAQPGPAEGAMAFQASGWIEPDPLPMRATALTDGVIDEVHVLEGAAVKMGDLLATLIDEDARFLRDSALRESERAQAALEAYSTRTASAMRKLDEEQARLVSVEADATEAADRLRRLERLTEGAIPETELVTARLENTRRAAVVNEQRARIGGIDEEITRIGHEIRALKAEAQVAEIKRAEAELTLRRTRVVAPADGRVLRLLAAPGQKKMLAMDAEESATVAILYHPAKLQVRVDVPLADAAGLGVGQRAKIHCNLLPDRVFDGEVTRITGEADVQRNTLQAKVRIHDPDERLRPEMLCRVEFFGNAPAASAATPGSSSLAVFVPLEAVADGAVWICDPESKRVSRRDVAVSAGTRDGYRRLNSGVRPGEWLVLGPSGLREGQRVKPQLAGSP